MLFRSSWNENPSLFEVFISSKFVLTFFRNMYKELTSDIEGFKAPNHGSLEKWAQQGVLLLNATLTVQAHKANSHASCGWQTFTDAVIKVINQRENVVFILWGGFAQKKGKAIDTKKRKLVSFKTHHRLCHPSCSSKSSFSQEVLWMQSLFKDKRISQKQRTKDDRLDTPKGCQIISRDWRRNCFIVFIQKAENSSWIVTFLNVFSFLFSFSVAAA